MKDLKKRLHRYIETHRKKGYSLLQIKKGLIVYGFEPLYVNNIINEYKLKLHIHLLLFFTVMVSLPLLAQPMTTGYFFLSPFGEKADYFEPMDIMIIAGFILAIVPLLLIVFSIGVKDKLRAMGAVELKFSIEKAKNFLGKIKTGFQLPKKNIQPEEEKELFSEQKSPVLILYNFLLGLGAFAIILSFVLRKWMLIFFGVIGIILSVIGKANVKRMYYKEEP